MTFEEIQSKGFNKIDFDLKKPSLDHIRQEVYMNFVLKKRSEATEVICDYIKLNNKIYTTRDDDKPEMWIYKDGIYVPNAKTYIQEMCRNILQNTFSDSLCRNITSKIEADTYIEAQDFFKIDDIYKLPVLNGILDLKQKKLLPFSDEYFFFNKLPINYYEKSTCDYILSHFRSTLKDENDLLVVQELFGYLLLRDYKFEKAFMFTGSGRNGKGKTLELMKRFIGADNCTNISLVEIESNNFALSQLHNKMANLSADLSKHALKHTGNFKTLTGHDLISADRKFQTRVNFVNYAKMIFACNELPITFDITTAFFNRWLLIDFPYTFVSKEEYDKLQDKVNYKVADREIINKLSTDEELSGLLNWALIGLERLIERQEFSKSTTTEETKIKWLRKSNSVSAFIIDCLVEDYDSIISKEDFRIYYTKYCRKNKVNIGNERLINYSLEQIGVISSRLNDEKRTAIWKGIKFKNGFGEGGEDGELFQYSIKVKNEKIIECQNISPINPSYPYHRFNYYDQVKIFAKKEVAIETLLSYFPQEQRGQAEETLNDLIKKGLIFETKSGFVKTLE